MSDPELDELLAVAKTAARAAGAALKARRVEWSGVEAEIGREIKVDADRRAEEIILTRLAAASALPVLSEERGWTKDAAGGAFWAVDPLDGSVNYIQGYPHCAVSVALMLDGAPILGVVDLFLLDECFAGRTGAGASLNGEPIRVSTIADPARGVLNTGIPAHMKDDPSVREALMRRMTQWRKVRMIGSAASALAYVAAGRADAYRESGSMLWDVAGGCALVAAAGGAVQLSALDGPLEVAASNGFVPMPD